MEEGTSLASLQSREYFPRRFMDAVETTQVHTEERSEEIRRLSQSVMESSPADAAELLSGHPDALIEEVLSSLNPIQLQEVLRAFPRARRELTAARTR